MTQQTQTRLLKGGLDLVTPVLAMRPGTVISAVNFEATEGGYKRCDGYERYDGQPKPSEADYALLPFSGGSVDIVAGTWVTGLTSNAIGLVVLQVITSGTTGAGNAVGNLVLDQIDGAFVTGGADGAVEFLAVEFLAAAVAFNHDDAVTDDGLGGGVAMAAFETLAAAANGRALLADAGVDHFVLDGGAFRAAHGS